MNLVKAVLQFVVTGSLTYHVVTQTVSPAQLMSECRKKPIVLGIGINSGGGNYVPAVLRFRLHLLKETKIHDRSLDKSKISSYG